MVRSPNPDPVETPCDERPRVIIVEDNDDLRSLLALSLEPIAEIVVCKNSTEALHYYLDAFRCRPHRGILMDIALPDINGIRTMAAIRELERGSTSECTPIHLGVLSGNAELVANTPAFNKLGVTLIVEKPFESVKFLSLFAAWLEMPAPELYVAGC